MTWNVFRITDHLQGGGGGGGGTGRRWITLKKDVMRSFDVFLVKQIKSLTN